MEDTCLAINRLKNPGKSWTQHSGSVRRLQNVNGMARLAARVDMFSVTHLYNRYYKKLICHFIDDSVNTLSNPVTLLP